MNRDIEMKIKIRDVEQRQNVCQVCAKAPGSIFRGAAFKIISNEENNDLHLFQSANTVS